MTEPGSSKPLTPSRDTGPHWPRPDSALSASGTESLGEAWDAAHTLLVSIVLGWNQAELTLAALASLARTDVPAGFRHRILLVDNGSTDDTVEAVRSALPQVSILRLPENQGFARGMNAGVLWALERGAEWTLLLNNDAEVHPRLLVDLLGSRPDPDVGMLTPTISVHDRPEEVWPSAGWRRRLTLAPFDTTAEPPSRRPYDVDWVAACCLLVRRQLWEDVGLFDERYRFYYEDHDLCLRAECKSWRMWHVPSARARHRVAGSTGEGSPRQRYLLARGSVPFYLAHTAGAHRALIVAYRAGSLVKTLLGCLRDGQAAQAVAILHGIRDGLADVRNSTFWDRDPPRVPWPTLEVAWPSRGSR